MVNIKYIEMVYGNVVLYEYINEYANKKSNELTFEVILMINKDIIDCILEIDNRCI